MISISEFIILLYLIIGFGLGVDAYWNARREDDENAVFIPACALYGLFWLPGLFFMLYIHIFGLKKSDK